MNRYGAIEKGVTNEQRALDRAWSYLGSKNYLVQCGAMSSKDEVTFKDRSEKLIAAFTKMEKQLSSDSTFYKSNTLSNVDIAWLPLLHRANIIKKYTGYDFLCELPKTQAWQKAVLDTGISENTVSNDFEQLFKDFYLTNTYLGEGKDFQQSEGCSSVGCCG